MKRTTKIPSSLPPFQISATERNNLLSVQCRLQTSLTRSRTTLLVTASCDPRRGLLSSSLSISIGGGKTSIRGAVTGEAAPGSLSGGAKFGGNRSSLSEELARIEREDQPDALQLSEFEGLPNSEIEAAKFNKGITRDSWSEVERPNRLSTMRPEGNVVSGSPELKRASDRLNEAEVAEILDPDNFEKEVEVQDALKIRAQELVDIATTRHPPKQFKYWDRHGPNDDSIEIPPHYEICGARPDMRMEDIKVKFLMECRQHHPEIGGNPERYMLICEGFETILAEHGLVKLTGEAMNFGGKYQRYLLSNTELNKSIGDFNEKLTSKATTEQFDRLIGEAEWSEKKKRDTPFREEKHVYNMFFRKNRDAPDADRAAPGDDSHEKMTPEEYQLALKRSDRLMERGNFAGDNAMVAYQAMWNTREAKDLQISIMILACVITIFVFTSLFVYNAYLSQEDMIEAEPDRATEIMKGSKLPWWGDDFAYERAVKRMFMEEYRKAKAASNREELYQKGLSRENMKKEEAFELDKRVFAVSADRLKELQKAVEDAKEKKKKVAQEMKKERLAAFQPEEGSVPRRQFVPRRSNEITLDHRERGDGSSIRDAEQIKADAAKIAVVDSKGEDGEEGKLSGPRLPPKQPSKKNASTSVTPPPPAPSQVSAPKDDKGNILLRPPADEITDIGIFSSPDSANKLRR